MTPFAGHDTAPLQLSWTDLDAGPPEAVSRASLSADEVARADRFVHAVHRVRYIRAHAWLRQALARWTGRPAAQLRFDVGPWGKPQLTGVPRCAFNLSHSDELAVLALAPDGHIGVDVERLRPMGDRDLLASHHFTAAEQAQLRDASANEADTVFLFGWTRKEACLKAVGCGLAVEPGSFHVGLQAVRHTVRIDGPTGPWDVTVQSFVDAGRAVVSWATAVDARGLPPSSDSSFEP